MAEIKKIGQIMSSEKESLETGNGNLIEGKDRKEFSEGQEDRIREIIRGEILQGEPGREGDEEALRQFHSQFPSNPEENRGPYGHLTIQQLAGLANRFLARHTAGLKAYYRER